MNVPIKFKNKKIKLHKAFNSPKYEEKSVLLDSTWEYVEMFLKREGKVQSLFYWNQAKSFYLATKQLTKVASPLTAYYCFLNLAKTLLTVKGVSFSDKHGVSGKTKGNGRIVLANELIEFKVSGILPSLAECLGEKYHIKEEYTMKDLLYNLPFIHRACTHTYSKLEELFIPIKNPTYYICKENEEAWIEFGIYGEELRNIDSKMDGSFVKASLTEEKYRMKKRFKWKKLDSEEERIKKLIEYHNKYRNKFHYISGDSDLWYIKRKATSTINVINKNTLLIMFAVMHRLSELSRYNPEFLQKHFERQQNWLLSEFIEKSLYQFLNEISTEITGNEFRVTGIRGR